MTAWPAPRAPAEEQQLPPSVTQAGPPSFERHPRDAYRLAAPYPLGTRAGRVLAALVEALCPPSPAPRSAELLRRVELGSRVFLRYMHPTVARALAAGLVLLDWLPVLTLKSGLRLHRMDAHRAGAFLARWGRSPVKLLRLLVQGTRSLVLSVYFDQSEVHAALGYDPVPFMRERLVLREHLLAPARAAAE